MVSHIQRPDGRKLAYEDAGPRAGTPVFYFHGVPSAGVDWRIWGDERLLDAQGVRLIAVDRPGVGASAFQPNRRLSDWPAEVAALADSLGFRQFIVLGYSGGGVYAAACAAAIPERLLAVGMVSSLTSFDRPELLEGVTPGNVQFLRLAVEKPWLFRVIYWQIRLMAKYAPHKYLANVLSTLGPADCEMFSRPGVGKSFLAGGGSPRGQQWDTRLIISPWDFNLQEIRIPVQLWHGDQDRNASPAMGRYLEQIIPGSRMNFLSGEGHLSLIANRGAAILKNLLQAR